MKSSIKKKPTFGKKLFHKDVNIIDSNAGNISKGFFS